MENDLNKQLASNIIRESNSAWASSLIVVRKKDNTNTLCIDYRQLNHVTEFDSFPMPAVDGVF